MLPSPINPIFFILDFLRMHSFDSELGVQGNAVPPSSS
jgi:hypothetical protein